MATVADPAAIRQCCMDLTKAHTSGDYERVLKIANKMLRQYQTETYAHKCKLVALIQLGQFDNAMELIKKTPESQIGNVSFEKAYILYRQNKLEDAVATLSNADAKDPGVIELKAQLAYKLEMFQESQQHLTELIRSHEDDYDDQRRANLIAVEAQLQYAGINNPSHEDQETFDQMYNEACHLIEQEKYPEALKMLDKAEATCRTTLAEDGYAEDEIDEELSSILIQKGFVLQKLGRQEEALEMYNHVQEMKPTDVNVRATLMNNYLSTESDANISDARKKLKVASRVDKTKLSKRQLSTLASNQEAIILLAKLKPRKKLDVTQKKDFKDTEIVTGKLRTRKRNRKIRLPKNYDPNIPPDPERWLPRTERTAFKKKVNKKFKDRDIGRGTQGAAGGANAERMDYSKNSPAPQSPQTPASPAAAAPAGPRQNRPAAAKQKKNKKRH